MPIINVLNERACARGGCAASFVGCDGVSLTTRDPNSESCANNPYKFLSVQEIQFLIMEFGKILRLRCPPLHVHRMCHKNNIAAPSLMTWAARAAAAALHERSPRPSKSNFVARSLPRS
jgi:hypothetical protein